jgi:hypothetical protein
MLLAALPAELKRFVVAVILLKRPELKPAIVKGAPYHPKLQSIVDDVAGMLESNIRMGALFASVLSQIIIYIQLGSLYTGACALQRRRSS